MNAKKILVYASSLLLAVGGGIALHGATANNESNLNLTTVVSGNHDHIAVKKAVEANVGEIVASDYVSNAVVQSVNNGDETYDLRFVALIKADELAQDGSGATLVGDFGFHIEFEGSAGSVEQDVVVTHYYNSISETVDGVTTYYTNEVSSLKNEANSKTLSEMPNYAEGYNLVIALTVEGIPSANMDTLFTAKPFVKVEEEAKYVDTKYTTLNAIENNEDLNFAVVDGEYTVLGEETELSWNANDVVSFVNQNGETINSDFEVPFTGEYNVTKTEDGVEISTTADVAGIVVDNASVSYNANQQFISVETPEGIDYEAKYYSGSNEVNPLKVGEYDVVVSFITDGTYSIEDYETTFEITAPEGSGFAKINENIDLSGDRYLGVNLSGDVYLLKNSGLSSATKPTLADDFTLLSNITDYSEYAWTFTKDGDSYAIASDSLKLGTGSSTNLAISSSGTGTWKFVENTTISEYYLQVSSDAARGLIYRKSTYNLIGRYSTSNFKVSDNAEYIPVSVYTGSTGVEEAKTLTVGEFEEGTIEVTTTSGSLEGLYSVDTVTVTVTPNAGSNIIVNSVSVGGKEYQLTNNNGVYTCTFNPTMSGEIVVDYYETYTITYNYNDETTSNKVLDGRHTKLPAELETPTREGYNFGGWYTDNETFTNRVYGSEVIEENVTLYAKWIEDSGVVETTVTATFGINVSSNVTLAVGSDASSNFTLTYGDGTTGKGNDIATIKLLSKGNSSSATALNSSSKEMRIYANKNGLGNQIEIALKDTTKKISSVEITYSGANYATYAVVSVGGNAITSSDSTTTKTYDAIDSSSFVISNDNTGNTGSAVQVRIKSIKITYTAA